MTVKNRRDFIKGILDTFYRYMLTAYYILYIIKWFFLLFLLELYIIIYTQTIYSRVIMFSKNRQKLISLIIF